VIVIDKTSAAVGWIIRAGPAVALLHLLYALYHLGRAPTRRTPASTAGYMIFAGLVDTGLIPFFLFSALMAHNDYATNAYRWTTLFKNDPTDYEIIHVFFLLSAIEGGLLLVSIVLDVPLAIIFRKIANMPPDMNPLEANLTARPHKRNKSELTVSDKHTSGSTTDLFNNRMSKSTDTAARRNPFMHTRADSSDSFTLIQDSSTRGSRLNLEMAASNCPSRPQSTTINTSPKSRAGGADIDHRPIRSPSPARSDKSQDYWSWLSYSNFDGLPVSLSNDAIKELDAQVRPLSPVSPLSSQCISRAETPERTDNNGQRNGTHPTNSQLLRPDLLQPSTQHTPPPKKRSRDPLGMNPPSPYFPQSSAQDENLFSIPRKQVTPDVSQSSLALQESSGNVQAGGRCGQPGRNSTFIGSGGKTRFYGDLRSSIGSFGHTCNNSETQRQMSNEWSPGDDGAASGEDEFALEPDFERTRSDISEYSNFQIHAVDDDGDDDQSAYSHEPVRIDSGSENWWATTKVDGTRQVSNSTATDLRGGYAGLGEEFGKGMGKRREVSGKLAEEGRSDEVLTRPGAAGWARFKGL